MNKYSHSKTQCKYCGSKDFEEIFKFNPFSVIKIDTLLISSRHMFRAPYSVHEKSGLVSVLIEPNKVMEFRKKQAKPERISFPEKLKFLDDQNADPGEGKELIIRSLDYSPNINDELSIKKKEYKIPEQAVPETMFPPCIKKILDGLEDGRKRALFVLTNFLSSSGWDFEDIENLIKEWNSKNLQPLRKNYIISHLSYHKKRKKNYPPPNCRKFYQDFQICFPDNLCQKIKNPLSYSKIKSFYLNKNLKKKKKLLKI
jgi:DNA primase large subunit